MVFGRLSAEALWLSFSLINCFFWPQKLWVSCRLSLGLGSFFLVPYPLGSSGSVAGDHNPLCHANPLQESAQLQPSVDRDWQEGSVFQQSWYLNDGEKSSLQKQSRIILCCSQLHVWRRHLTRVCSLWVPRLGLHNYRFSMTHCQVRCRFKDRFWEK